MAQRTIDQFYSTYAEAVQVVADLTASGIPAVDISLIESETDARLPEDVVNRTPQNPVATGFTLGIAIGAGLGALDGVGAITIPYTDPLVATGWVLPCVVFAVLFALIGAVIGAIVKMTIRNKQGLDIATRLKRGQHLVMVRVDDAQVPMVQSVMARTHTVPTAALATTTPLYDGPVQRTARTVGDEVAPIEETVPLDRVERRTQYR